MDDAAPPMSSGEEPPVSAPPLAVAAIPTYSNSMHESQFLDTAAELARAGFARPTWIHAVVGKSVDLTDRTLLSKEALYQLRRGRSHGSELPSAGAVGCYQRHVQALRDIATGDAAYAMVTEDDCRFNDGGVAAALQQTFTDLDAAGVTWDMFQVGGGSLMPTQPTALPNIERVVDRFYGTECYVVTRPAAQRLLQDMLPIRMQVDAFFGTLVYLGDVDMLTYARRPAYQAPHASTIQNNDRHVDGWTGQMVGGLVVVLLVSVAVVATIVVSTNTTTPKPPAAGTAKES